MSGDDLHWHSPFPNCNDLAVILIAWLRLHAETGHQWISTGASALQQLVVMRIWFILSHSEATRKDERVEIKAVCNVDSRKLERASRFFPCLLISCRGPPCRWPVNENKWQSDSRGRQWRTICVRYSRNTNSTKLARRPWSCLHCANRAVHCNHVCELECDF